MGLIRTTVLVGAAALLAATPTLADNTVLTPEQTKVLHKLQERCGKDAAEFVSNVKTANDGRFPQLYPGTPDVEFQNHYSSRFNKCFVWTFVSGREMLGNARLSEASVWSAADNRVIADFVTYNRRVSVCWAVDPAQLNGSTPDPNRFDLDPSASDQVKLCASPGETLDDFAFSAWSAKWNALIKPYMQDSE